jgi:hypothetical protein
MPHLTFLSLGAPARTTEVLNRWSATTDGAGNATTSSVNVDLIDETDFVHIREITTARVDQIV